MEDQEDMKLHWEEEKAEENKTMMENVLTPENQLTLRNNLLMGGCCLE